jgi:hypothetical protein
MEGRVWQRRLNGHVEITELPRIDGPVRQLISKRLLYRWEPPFQLRVELPDWFTIALECWVGNDGTRRFSLPDSSLVPPDDSGAGLRHISTAPGLAGVASIGGHRLLIDRGNVGRGILLGYDEARIIIQYTRHLREYLGGTIKFERGLNVCREEQYVSGAKTILPHDLGLDGRGIGDVWGLSRLREEGLHEAQADGIKDPSPAEIVRYGLLVAAKRNPLYLNQKEAAQFTRLALFALPDSSKPSPRQLAYVADRACQSLQKHLNDSNEEFGCWIKDDKSDLIRSISKSPSCRWSRSQVRRALLELGWRALQSMGKCIDLQMRSFRDVFPQPLTPQENRFYAQSFLANPLFGGLPLVLIHERLTFLKEAILEVWNSQSDRESIAVVHQMMNYYSVLTGNRRAADRLYKRRVTAKTLGGSLRSKSPKSASCFAPREPSELEETCEIARRLAIARGCDLRFGERKWEANLSVVDDRVSIVVKPCGSDRDEYFDIPIEEFVVVARKVREGWL